MAIDECELDARGGCHADALCSYVGPGQVRLGWVGGARGSRGGAWEGVLVPGDSHPSQSGSRSSHSENSSLGSQGEPGSERLWGPVQKQPERGGDNKAGAEGVGHRQPQAAGSTPEGCGSGPSGMGTLVTGDHESSALLGFRATVF